MNSEKKYLFWIDSLKAFAILSILLNHLVESYGSSPWFSNPSYDWPNFSIRLLTLFPSDGPILWRIGQFIGWLGDMGPGVFILLSGFTLTLSFLNKNEKQISITDFYLRRLLRIFPLYLVIHLLIMFCGALLNEGIDFTAPKVFISMLGLRATDGLFYYINPSWWFIWLIIQLYLIFPLLFKFLARKGINIFLIVTLTFTILSRLSGLLNFTYSNSLEHWMAGIFFGTRLFEFTFGMILAKLYYERKFNPWELSFTRFFVISMVIYGSGFICSLFYPTTLISSFLITIGLSGLFLSFSKYISLFVPALMKAITWIGIVSFPVFLIHQPLLLWIGNNYSGTYGAIVKIFILILAFPAGWFIEKLVNFVISLLPNVNNKMFSKVIVFSLGVQVFLNLGYFITEDNMIYKSDMIIFIINIFFIPLYILTVNRNTAPSLKSLLITFIPFSVLFLFVFTNNWFNIFWIFILVLLVILLLISLFTKNVGIRVLITYTVFIILFISVESWLAKNHPLETNKWGESPALRKDPLTTYALIPNRKTHLKYNNYDYIVNANSLGFNGPEVILPEKDSNSLRIFLVGDAFTMPEGMEYGKAYPEILKEILAGKYPEKKIVVVNGAVTGFGPNEMYAQLKKYIDIIKPDIYINQVFINEFEEIRLKPGQRLNSIGFRDFTLREKLFSGLQILRNVQLGSHKLFNDKSYRRYNYNKSLTYFYERSSDLYSEENIRRVNNFLVSTRLLCEEKKCKFYVLYAPGQLEVSAPKEISYYPYEINLADSVKYKMDLPRSILRRLCCENEIPLLDPTEILRGILYNRFTLINHGTGIMKDIK